MIILGSCSSETNVKHLRTEKVSTDKTVSVIPNHILTMEVEGMTCEMGCGGSIRKELKSTGGVSRVEFDFVEGRKIQSARISFDDAKVSQKEMVKIVSTMNDKQFKVGKSSTENLDQSLNSSIESTSDSDEQNVEISESEFAIPNLIDILSGII
jgi:copper chaperone CopZ